MKPKAKARQEAGYAHIELVVVAHAHVAHHHQCACGELQSLVPAHIFFALEWSDNDFDFCRVLREDEQLVLVHHLSTQGIACAVAAQGHHFDALVFEVVFHQCGRVGLECDFALEVFLLFLFRRRRR